MATPRTTVEALRKDAANGELARILNQNDVDLLIMFGSARKDPETAHDVDLGYCFRTGKGDDLAVVNALGERYGDALDLMPIDRADSVARWAALSDPEILVELTPHKYSEQSITAFGMFCDSQWLRDRALKELQK